jgi:hypothetical protein
VVAVGVRRLAVEVVLVDCFKRLVLLLHLALL